MKKFMNTARNTVTLKVLNLKRKLYERKAEGYVDTASASVRV